MSKSKPAKKGSSEIAFRPTTLTEARCNCCSRNQNILLDILFGQMSNNDDIRDNLVYTIKASEIKHLFPDFKNKQSLYTELRRTAESFVPKVNGDPRLRFVMSFIINGDIYPIFSRIPEYNNAEIKLYLDKKFKDLYIESSQGFYYNIAIPISFKSKWAQLLYYHLGDHLNYKDFSKNTVGTFVESLEKLVTVLNVPSSYNTGMLKVRVLEPGIKEINEKSNIHIEYEELTSSTKSNQTAIVGYKFIVTPNNNYKPVLQRDETVIDVDYVEIPQEPAVEDVKKVFARYKLLEDISNSDIEVIIKTAKGDITKIETAADILASNKKDVSNPIGFILEAIAKNYKKSPGKKAPAPFPGRNINFEDLENQLLKK